MPHLYEKSWPEKGGYPLPLLSAKVSLSERLYEKNLIPVGANSAFWLSRHDMTGLGYKKNSDQEVF